MFNLYNYCLWCLCFVYILAAVALLYTQNNSAFGKTGKGGKKPSLHQEQHLNWHNRKGGGNSSTQSMTSKYSKA